MTESLGDSKEASPIDENKQLEKKAPDSPIEPEVLGKLPPEVQGEFERLVSVTYLGPVFNPLLNKVNEAHIHKALDYADKSEQRECEGDASVRKYNLVYALLAAGLFVFITLYLAGKDAELYRDLLTKLIVFFGGAGAGYGFKAYRDRNK